MGAAGPKPCSSQGKGAPPRAAGTPGCSRQDLPRGSTGRRKSCVFLRAEDLGLCPSELVGVWVFLQDPTRPASPKALAAEGSAILLELACKALPAQVN